MDVVTAPVHKSVPGIAPGNKMAGRIQSSCSFLSTSTTFEIIFVTHHVDQRRTVRSDWESIIPRATSRSSAESQTCFWSSVGMSVRCPTHSRFVRAFMGISVSYPLRFTPLSLEYTALSLYKFRWTFLEFSEGSACTERGQQTGLSFLSKTRYFIPVRRDQTKKRTALETRKFFGYLGGIS